METLVNLVVNQGFAVGVAIYSLVVLNKTIQKNTDIMTKIATKLGVGTNEVSK